MEHEIELKLDVPAKAATRLPRAPWLEKLASAPVRRQNLVSVYFDTRAFKLRNASLSLRVRHVGDKTVQTIKHDPKGACGAFTRQEWEREIASDEPDLEFAKDTALAQFNLKKLGRKLRPVFETDVDRIAIPLNYHNNELELAIDRGEVRAGRRREPVSEIEIEIKNNESTEAIRFARRIAAETGASYGAKTKAERGYALSADEAYSPVFGDEIILRPAMPAGQAFQAIGLACRPGFFLPVRVLSRLFRRLFLKKLKAAHAAGRLCFHGEHSPLAERQAFTTYLQSFEHPFSWRNNLVTRNR